MVLQGICPPPCNKCIARLMRMVGVIVITDEDHVKECGRWSVSLSVKIDNIYEDCVIKCGGGKSLFCFQHLKSTKGSN